MSIEARTTGFCPACGKPIHIGDRICTDPLDGDQKSWMHVACPPEPAPRPVCPNCLDDPRPERSMRMSSRVNQERTGASV